MAVGDVRRGADVPLQQIEDDVAHRWMSAMKPSLVLAMPAAPMMRYHVDQERRLLHDRFRRVLGAILAELAAKQTHLAYWRDSGSEIKVANFRVTALYVVGSSAEGPLAGPNLDLLVVIDSPAKDIPKEAVVRIVCPGADNVHVHWGVPERESSLCAFPEARLVWWRPRVSSSHTDTDGPPAWRTGRVSRHRSPLPVVQLGDRWHNPLASVTQLPTREVGKTDNMVVLQLSLGSGKTSSLSWLLQRRARNKSFISKAPPVDRPIVNDESRAATNFPMTRRLAQRSGSQIAWHRMTTEGIMRRRHNEMTNALRRVCAKAHLVVDEGTQQACLFDALIRNYLGTGRDLLVEVKTEIDVPTCHMAVGQLLDYRRQLPSRATTDLAVLLPDEPSADMLAFFEYAGVKVMWLLGMNAIVGQVRFTRS